MNAMTQTITQDVQWFAVRMKPNASGGPRTAIVDVVKEQYTTRSGVRAWRRVKGTGKRVFLPEYLLQRAGFEVFLPVKQDWRIKNRHTKEKHLVSIRILADWMFVGLPIVDTGGARRVHGWEKLMELDVVSGVLGTGGRPVMIPTSRIARLKRQWGGKKEIRKAGRKSNLQSVVGQTVKVPDGPFEDFDFKILEINSAVARGVVEIFGRDTPLELQTDRLGVGDMDQGQILPFDLDQSAVSCKVLSACQCGFRMARVVRQGDGYCVRCSNCGRRAAFGSRTADEAEQRWDKWRATSR